MISVAIFFNPHNFSKEVKRHIFEIWPFEVAILACFCEIVFVHFSMPNFKGRRKRGHRRCYQSTKYKFSSSCTPPTTTTHPNDNINQNNHMCGDIDISSRIRCNNINSNNFATNIVSNVDTTKINTSINTTTITTTNKNSRIIICNKAKSR